VTDAHTTEAKEADIEEENADEEEDYNTLVLAKPNHLDFEESTVSEADVSMMMKLGYFGETEKKLLHFAGEETIPEPKNDEVVVFKSFFKAGLWFPLHEMIGEALNNYEIYLHHLTPNAIVRLSIFIWARRSQEWTQMPKPSAECMSYIIRRRLEKMGFMRILAVTTSLTTRI
jgi:hypothetical protein